MNDRQLYGLFAVKRSEDGTPDLPDPMGADLPTAEGVYRRHLWLNGITDRAEQTRLWNEERDRRGRRNR